MLPDWVVREVKYSSDYVTLPLTKEKITRGLFAATRDDDLGKPLCGKYPLLAKRHAGFSHFKAIEFGRHYTAIIPSDS